MSARLLSRDSQGRRCVLVLPEVFNAINGLFLVPDSLLLIDKQPEHLALHGFRLGTPCVRGIGL
jgi:hypothetical protein